MKATTIIDFSLRKVINILLMIGISFALLSCNNPTGTNGKITDYSITYNLNGGTDTSANPTSYNTKSADIILAEPMRTDYVFIGWYDNAADTGIPVTTISTGSMGDKTFWAAWIPEDNYSITYDLNGGTNTSTNPTSYNIESIVTLAEPTKNGYTFTGWYDNPEYTGTPVTTILIGSKGNKTFWATWTTNVYTIKYVLNDGINSTTNPESYNIESADITLAEPTKNGYIFNGWYDNEANTGATITTISTGSTGDKTFYAAWVTGHLCSNDNVANTIKSLSGKNPYSIVVTGPIINNTLSDIRSALQENSTAQVLIDLSQTTGLTTIGVAAFSSCNNLMGITIPENVTTIDTAAFGNCNNLTSITIPFGVTSIGEYAFSSCSSLTNITIPDGVKSIGKAAFWHCHSLTSITIPESVTDIGEYAFQNCSSLTSITIPESVTSIGEYAFQNCNSLTTITIPNSVTSIGEYAFQNCSSLTSITIPSKTTSIEEYTFQNCSSLSNIAILSGVKSIGNGAFSSCNNLTNIAIPESVTSIGEGAFVGCNSLKSITIPESMTTIESFAFAGCSGLIFSIASGNTLYAASDDGRMLLSKDGKTLYYYPSASGNVTTLGNVTSIGEYAFSSCNGLTSITIPESVTSIGKYALAGCSGLTSITFGGTGSWYYTSDSNHTGGTPIGVTVPTENAENLSLNFLDQFWYKN